MKDELRTNFDTTLVLEGDRQPMQGPQRSLVFGEVIIQVFCPSKRIVWEEVMKAVDLFVVRIHLGIRSFHRREANGISPSAVLGQPSYRMLL